MEHLKVKEKSTRYDCLEKPFGVDEKTPLDFHSPYGCSKGIADQYFIDYGRIYGLKTVVFRQSCIYGPHQFGIEDQGWVAWFAIATLLDRDLTIYGTGKQVRDILHVKDLVELYTYLIVGYLLLDQAEIEPRKIFIANRYILTSLANARKNTESIKDGLFTDILHADKILS